MFGLLMSSDNCKKMGVVFENVVGIVEIINSKSIQLQVRKMFRKLIFIKPHAGLLFHVILFILYD